MFNSKSRYKNTEQYKQTDKRGRTVNVVAVPSVQSTAIAGYHLLKQGQRTDHLAAQYLNDAAAFWRIVDANVVMLPEALSEATEVAIPEKN